MGSGEKRNEMVAVAIDKDKGSQAALKWAVDHLLQKSHSVSLVHVNQRSIPSQLGNHSHGDNQSKELFLPFRCFCTRKNIKCNEVILEDMDITKALCDYVRINLIEILVVGAPTRNSFVRFKTDVPSSISKAAPEFCTVYVISKGKISSVQKATCPVPNPPHRNQLLNNNNTIPNLTDARSTQNIRDFSLLTKNHPDPISAAEKTPFRPSAAEKTLFRPSAAEKTPFRPRNLIEDDEIRSPFDRSRTSNRPYGELSLSNTDISFVSSGRPSTENTHPSFHDSQELVMAPWLSSSSDTDNGSFGSSYSGFKLAELNMNGFSSSSQESANFSWSSSQNLEDVEAEMRRLKQELQQTIDMYSSACKEALTAKQKRLCVEKKRLETGLNFNIILHKEAAYRLELAASHLYELLSLHQETTPLQTMELQRWKMEEQKRIEEALLAEEAALAIAEREKAKSKAAIEAAEAAQRIAQLEAQKRMNAEMKALKEAEEKKKVLDVLAQSDIRYRKYNIEEIEAATENFTESRKIGEGGYGPVYKCHLNHTQVAVKVLRPDAAQGRSQFQQEVEVLSCIRHPNMVLLLGACPEYGCLVYEYMANGSLEDRLFRRGNTPVLPWQIRFRIAAEIGTGLLFLHQTKPEPLVHRDLKPANILLDRNFVSKISDVGLARLVPPSIADSITQYRMTATAGTFCYIDPEYQQTGMLGTKSDIYSFGILLLQIVTSKPPMGLTHHVERAIERGTFADFLDPAVPDWPVEEAMNFVKLALKCAELRRKDRPDLGTVILPELERLRALAEERMPNIMMSAGSPGASPSQSQVSTSQDILSGPQLQHSGYGSSQSRSST